MAAIKRPLRVLVADDEKVIADSLAIIFRDNGFDATAVYNGPSAIETAAQLQPDVVISDVLMPGMSGVDAVLNISRRLPQSEFVLFSGHADCQQSLIGAQANGLKFVYLHKPVPPQLLIEYLAGCAIRLQGEGVAPPPVGNVH
jgi:CheY-like chemotaxis protein